MELARYVDEMYHLLSTAEWHGLAFDWEIVPTILDTIVWGPAGPTTTLPVTRTSAMEILERFRAKRFR